MTALEATLIAFGLILSLAGGFAIAGFASLVGDLGRAWRAWRAKR